MRALLFTFFFVLMSIVLSNCQTTVIQINPSSEPMIQPSGKVRYGSAAFGYIDVTKNYESPCGQNVNQVVIRRDWLDSLIHFAIGGIYTTRSVDVYCSGK